ncbi:hypothetical protein [Streptomyces varsoviensis]|uniref:hypothetical protein n=1 Tax=Streptomyces varsoviensis TaxID=67373 RepID=UPI0004CA9123|nr:hypothetical protein [Streptomyces varsoviensis]
MTGTAPQLAHVLTAAADAARATPGVAFLRPGLADVVRGAAARRLPAGAGSAVTAWGAARTRVAGVRAERTPGTGGWQLRVHLAVRRGHQALAVTRAVRAAVTSAVAAAVTEAGEPEPPIAVTVTVTDIT